MKKINGNDGMNFYFGLNSLNVNKTEKRIITYKIND